MSRSTAAARARAIIVVPCYNEAKRLDTAAFLRFVEREPDIAFCFVNDGSRDDTAAVLRRLCEASPRCLMLDLAQNSGKAEAVRHGVLHALSLGPEYVGYWDADLATPLESIPMLLDVIRQRPSLLVAMGARVQLLGRDIQREDMRHYVGRVMASLTALALRVRVYDTQCGAKVMRADPRVAAAFDRPFRHRWLFDVEMIARVLAGSASASPHTLIYEVPLVTWREVPGSNVRLRDGISALFELYRIWRRHGMVSPPRVVSRELADRAYEHR
jgi:dolichyl-phosphate beta-glucosyltransferase